MQPVCTRGQRYPDLGHKCKKNISNFVCSNNMLLLILFLSGKTETNDILKTVNLSFPCEFLLRMDYCQVTVKLFFICLINSEAREKLNVHCKVSLYISCKAHQVRHCSFPSLVTSMKMCRSSTGMAVAVSSIPRFTST